MSVRQSIWGQKYQAIEQTLEETDPVLHRWIADFAYEEVLARPGLDLRTRELLAITSLIALGNPRELATHLEGAMRCGATPDELREVIRQSAIFLGFPRALGAMKMLQAILQNT